MSKLSTSLVAEFIGTFALIFIGAGAGALNAGLVGVSFAHGLVIVGFAYAYGHISGTHINPAVTFAAMLTGKIKVSTAALYVGAQLIGAVLGVLLLKAIVAGPVEQGLGAHSFTAYDLAADQIGLLDDQVGDGAGAALLMEMALTFMLVFTVFATAMDPKGMGNLAPIAIGLAVVVGHLAGVSFTGASMNPARSFGPAIASGVLAGQVVYWVGPILGAIAAALVWEFGMLRGEPVPPKPEKSM